MEHLSLDRRPFDHASLGIRQPVEPRREQRLNRRRQLDPLDRAGDLDPVVDPPQVPVVDQHPDELLDKQGVALGRGQDPVGDGLGEIAAEQLTHERPAVRLGERLQEQRGRVQLPTCPSGPLVQELGTGHAQQQHRHIREPVRQIVNQIKQGRLRPVDVIEGDDERQAGGHRLAEAPQREPGVLDAGARTRKADQRAHAVAHLAGAVGLDQRRKPCADIIGGVALVDAGERLHHLGQRPVGHALAIGEATARADGGLLEPGEELRHQARLADTGRAKHRHELAGALLGRPVEGVLEHPPLPHAADQRCGRRPHPAGVVVVQRHHAKCGDGICLPAQVERLDVLGDDRGVNEPMGRRAHQNLPNGRRLLQACRGVHRVAGRDRPTGRGGADDHLARGDADAHVEPHTEGRFELISEPADGLASLHGRADAAQGVVLVGRRHAEERHHGVADELLQMASMPFERCRHRREVPVHHTTHRLGIEPLAQLRRPGDVGEEHRHHPAPRGRGAAGRGGCRARGAEPGPFGQDLAAARAGRTHTGSIPGGARPVKKRRRPGAPARGRFRRGRSTASPRAPQTSRAPPR